MRLTVFGATGKTGRHVVSMALERGHEVTAFTRSPGKAEWRSDRLRVLTGDVADETQVVDAVHGADAVVSTLHATRNTPDYQVARGMQHIVTGMQRHGVGRLVMTTGAGVAYEKDQPRVADRVIKALLLLFARHVYEDMRRATEIVRGSGLAYTVVRIPMLVDRPDRGAVRIGYVGRGAGSRVSRPDVARFLLDELERAAHVRDEPVVSH